MGFLNRLKKEQELPENQEIDEATMEEKVGDNNIESGMPELDTAPDKGNSVNKAILLGGALFATGLIVAGLIYYAGGSDDESAKASTAQLDMVGNTQAYDFQSDKSAIAAEKDKIEAASQVQPEMASDTAAPEPNTDEIEVVETPTPQPTDNDKSQATTEPAMTPHDRKLTGHVLVEVGSSNSTNQPAQPNETAEMGNQANGGLSFGSDGSGEMTSNDGQANSESHFGSRLNPTTTASTRAFYRGDRTYLMSKGTNIACTLETKIITTLPGFTRCLVTKDVYSANGKVLLLERGTKITGEQTSAMLQGQARVFVLWNEAETPRGVKINLASPAAGQLGEAGVGARVNYHFFQRFGGAVMISLIGDLGDYYNNRAGNSGDGNKITFENSSESAQDMAAEALRNSINIPPTGYINQGTIINIMVARDVNFNGVYERFNPFLMQ